MTIKMPYRIISELITGAVQWAWIMSIGFFSATQISYKDDIHKIVITTISMVVGTVVSFVVKVQVNRLRNKVNKSYQGNYCYYLKSKFIK